MKRKNLILLALLTAFSLSAQEKMNVLFISIDDLKTTLGCYGNEQIISPHIDELAAMGVTFQNSYCQQAVCAASRTSVFTGMRPDRTGVVDLKTDMRDINPDVVTLPQLLKQNGYTTVGMGKVYHGARNNDPISWTIPFMEDKEFDYAEGFSYPANGKYQAPEIHEAIKGAKKQKLNWKETNKYLKSKNMSPSVECMDIPDHAYEDGALALQAIKTMDELKDGDEPFFLALGFHKPHLPFSVPKKYWDMYDRNEVPLAPHREEVENAPGLAYHSWGELRNYSDIPQQGPLSMEKEREVIHGYWASVSYVDAQLGLVLDHLKATGLDKNTMIVLWGDHGWHLGDHGQWCKHSNFEQATKAPLMFYVPGMAKGKNAYTMAEFVDIYPTILDVLDIDGPDVLEGNSLKPAIKKPKTEVKDRAFSQFTRGPKVMGYTMRTSRYRVTLWLSGEFYEGPIVDDPKVIAQELYDYQEDPNETRSLAKDPEYAAVFEELKAELLAHLKQQNKDYGKK